MKSRIKMSPAWGRRLLGASVKPITTRIDRHLARVLMDPVCEQLRQLSRQHSDASATLRQVLQEINLFMENVTRELVRLQMQIDELRDARTDLAALGDGKSATLTIDRGDLTAHEDAA